MKQHIGMDISTPSKEKSNIMNGVMFFHSRTEAASTICAYLGNNENDLNIINNNSEILRPLHEMGNYFNKENDQPINSRHCNDLYRPIVPRDYDIDENSTYTSGVLANPGLKYFHMKNGFAMLDQTIIFEDVSQSMPNISNNFNPENSYQQNMHPYNNDGSISNRNRRQRQFNWRKNRYIQSADNKMVKRIYGLVQRFKARSEFMKIQADPAKLLLGGPLDQLSQAIWDVFDNKAQKVKTYENKIMLWKDIFFHMRFFYSFALYMVGSTMTGFALDTSDIDMCLLVKTCSDNPRMEAINNLKRFRCYLIKYGVSTESELILAKVPILKFKHDKSGFEVDLNCNNDVGIYNTHLLHCYARLDWRVRPLVVIIKLWAQANGINDAKNMTVSSYSWALMVLHYLQCGTSPPVLPCLHVMFPEKFDAEKLKITEEDLAEFEIFHSNNTSCLAELLIGFFCYYTFFDYKQYAVSIRSGYKMLIEECRNCKAPKNQPHQWKYLCIEEPFDFTNTARSVYDFETFNHIKNVIKCSYMELINSKLLNNILPVNFSMK